MKPKALCLLVCLMAAPELAAAEKDAAPEPRKPGAGALYVPLEPSFVTNFGGIDGGRLQYVKADVSLRVDGSDAVSVARHHLPALRNALVLLLSAQDEGALSTSAGREAIRAQALVQLRGILEIEEGVPYIEDVLFTNFIVQR